MHGCDGCAFADMFALDKGTMRERAELSKPQQEEEKPYWEQPIWLVRQSTGGHKSTSDPK